MGEKVGEGAHAVVKECFHRVTGERLAVKSERLEQEHVYFMKQNFMAIQELNHPCLVRYRALYFDRQHRTTYLVM